MESTSQSMNLKHGIHALAGGKGIPVILLPGWPETADAYSEIFSFIAEHYQTFAVDPPGIGDSAPSSSGCDTGIISKILEESIRPFVSEPYHLVGHDVGGWIAYAWAAQFPERVRSLNLLDCAVPGWASQPLFPLPYQVNLKLWQFSFNMLPELPEVLTQGRERELLNWLFDRKADHPQKITEAKRDRYVECYSRPGAMSHGFEYYRSCELSASQNLDLGKKKLQMPVLALGGKSGMSDDLRKLMEPRLMCRVVQSTTVGTV